MDDYGASARLLAATTLRNVLGTKNLGDILSDREAIAQDMQVTLFYYYSIVWHDWSGLSQSKSKV